MALYEAQPPANIVAGKVSRPGYYKRSGAEVVVGNFDPKEIWVDKGNSTRKASNEEMLENFVSLRCKNSDCCAELEDICIKSAQLVGVSPTAPTTPYAFAPLTLILSVSEVR
ncbi:hypothetical protein CORC01_03724 [Colletotrichum orchidophilum]|uniref:Uncharacterized protein n=1 Tax=Colletotrichum orchidophilum TaxID=1209926 RepID=A0A1G4BHT2_9PEZI|nr:uncharacterized protein CORC01_03724 [Colletotrichum orchidophilum]OHF00896.1 hypothetical protein CORC01_03724 [Colletotrichum orchidophilum]